MEHVKLSLDTIIERIRDNDTFAFSRWGDGEWSCILGADGANCDGHKYYRSLGIELASVLVCNPEYFTGMQPMAMRIMGGRIKQWLDEMGIKRGWCNADVIHEASENGEMDKFFTCLNRCNWHLVSSFTRRELEQLPLIIKSENINVPFNNAWAQYPAIKGLVLHRAEIANKGDVILFCAGMMSKVLIDDVHKLYGSKLTLIDIGSAFDPYAKRVTRNYHVKVADRLERMGK